MLKINTFWRKKTKIKFQNEGSNKGKKNKDVNDEK